MEQIDEARVFVKPNFVENDDTAIRWQDRKNVMIYAGRIDELKGVDVMLHAWKKLGSKAPELIICGTGPMEKWCREFVTDNHLEKITFMGFVANQKVKGMLAEAKALILPTQWYEGFPMSIVEAFSVGTPVIGSDIGNTGDIVANGGGLTFQHDSAEALAETVKKICDDSGNICQRVEQLYKNRYSEEVNYTILNRIYNSITV